MLLVLYRTFPLDRSHDEGSTHAVRDNVGVTVERSLWVSVRGVVAGQVPDDESLVAGTRQEHVWILEGGSKGGDPAAVALKGALQDKSLRHDYCCRLS